jgi:hypothetical protein
MLLMIPKAESIMIKPIIIACLCVSSLAMADDPISADRPGFSSGTYTVAPGRINAEFGYQYSANNHGIDQSTHTLPLMVLRAGFLSDMEIDLMWAGWNIDKVGEQSSTNSHSDLTVATKYRLHRGNDFNLTALASISLPIGSEPSTSDSTDPLIGLLWDYQLVNDVSLFGVAQVSSFKVAGSREQDLQLAIGASFSHSDGYGSFVELYTIQPFDSRLDDEVVIDGGITYLVNNDLQLDFNIGLGLNDTSSDFVGVGVATRF